MKESTRVLLALGAGLGGGIAVAASSNPKLLHAAEAVAPVGVVWITAIRMTVIPLLVALVITGVAGAADLRVIGRIGGRAPAGLLVLLPRVPPARQPPASSGR